MNSRKRREQYSTNCQSEHNIHESFNINNHLFPVHHGWPK